MAEQKTENDLTLTPEERVAPFLCPACGHHADTHGTVSATCNVGGFLDPCGCSVLRLDIPGLVLRHALRFPPAVSSTEETDRD